MRKFTVLLILCSLPLFSSCRGIFNCEEGNGDVQTYQINIDDFKHIEVNGSGLVVVNNEVGDGTMKLTVDNNLRRYIEVRNSGNTLVLGTQDGVSLCPTKLKFEVSTTEIGEIDIDGSADLLLDDPFTGQGNIDIEIDGSGDVVFDDSVEAMNMSVDIDGNGDVLLRKVTITDRSFSIDIDGSGKVKCENVIAPIIKADSDGSGNISLDFDCSDIDVGLAGSGDFIGAGLFENLRCETAGSGNILMENAAGKSCVCNLIGSGSLQVNVSESITGKILGSGDIFVWGNPPSIDISIFGSGKIVKKTSSRR